ncbi:MAG: hypothetical protein M1833_000379 [Piccolia ochrophora]|nr:MAG: hypothetical protein M1833_000379 [Piccolia ochrophora]
MSHKQSCSSESESDREGGNIRTRATEASSSDEDTTETKLALIASLRPELKLDVVLEILLANHGSVERAIQALSAPKTSESPRKKAARSHVSRQTSLLFPHVAQLQRVNAGVAKSFTKKGKTLHLYSPDDVATHTPCSIIHNFLDPVDAQNLLTELLLEARSFEKQSFKVFDNVVQSPHTACFYVETLEEQTTQRTEYVYNGSYLTLTPQMRHVSPKVQEAVNHEIDKRIKGHYPGGKKLRYQSPRQWIPNAAFVNCYDGGGESVGFHSDQLTYLGPRPIIGSLSLGVSREFRIRKVIPRDRAGHASGDRKNDDARADAEGQISVHLPHNSLLVMHADMQEEYKHSISPAQVIDPHPLAGKKRINVTYRFYRESFHPKHTPRCSCGIPTVLRCVQRRSHNLGKYFWMCHAGLTPGKHGYVKRYHDLRDININAHPRT